MRHTLLSLTLAAAFALVGAPTADAASITFANETFSGGSGWGNVLGVLGLQQAPQAVNESGAISWNGSADVTSGDATNQSTTRTVTELIAKGITASDPEIGLIFNINDTTGNKTVNLSSLVMNFYSSAGALLFSAPYTCVACPYPFPLLLDETAQGLGNSGFLFRVALSQAERTAFFSNPVNRVGLSATVLNTDNGPEQFYLADIYPPDRPLDPSPVPEPASLFLIGSGLAMLGYRRFLGGRR